MLFYRRNSRTRNVLQRHKSIQDFIWARYKTRSLVCSHFLYTGSFFSIFFFLFMYVRSIEVLVCEFSYGIHSNNSTMYIWKVMCTVHKYTDLNQHRSSRSQGPNLSQLLGELWSSIPLVYTYICIQITYMNMK